MASNFFEQQDVARKNTRWLVVLFCLAVLSLITFTNLFLIFFPWEWHTQAFSQHGANHEFVCLISEGCKVWRHVNWSQVIVVSVLISSVIVIVSLFKWLQIRQGGKKIAEMMGGILLEAQTTDIKEQRLLNVVEEMALAANMPVPAVYVLKEEQGINAFAAGFSSRDAVIAVTQGALDSFTRDQLQGVVAHEFSHILNGDMRLNMKLIAILFGIMFITEAGLMFMRGSRFSNNRRNEGPILFLGLGLVILGSLGTLFGNMIKAAVSRQREFLADASAVQFTRNPSGIADALKIIGGSQQGSLLGNEHSAEMSHLFFGAGLSRVASLFATHPPLKQRILRVEPHWDGHYLSPSQAQQAAKIADDDEKERQKIAAIIAVAAASEVVEPQFAMLSKLSEPLTAAAIVLCLLHDKQDDKQRLIIESLAKDWPELYAELKVSLWMDWSRQDFVPVVNRAIHGLRSLTEEQYKLLKRYAILLIRADGVTDLYEWSLYQLLRSHLDGHFSEQSFVRQKYRKIEAIEDSVKQVIAMVVASSRQDQGLQNLAWQTACQAAGLKPDKIMPEVSISEFGQAVNQLALAFPLVKPKIIKALIEAAKADGVIEPIERQCIMAISAAIDAPLPDVLLNELEAHYSE